MRVLYRLLCAALAAGLVGSAPAAEPTGADSAPASEIEAPVRGTAQVPELGTPKEDELRRPFLRAARTAVPPTIDGDLTDEVWARGTPIRELFVDQPVEGDPLPQKTEIRVLYDDDALYFAAWCYDTEPDEITASLMRRDANVRNQDFIMILLDPFGERRSGYAFAVTPITTRWDVLIEETGGYNQEWDGIWYAQARRNDEGWVVEIAIPFKSLNFPEGRSTWGFNISRGIARYNQFGRWAFPLQHAFLFDPGYWGDLGGLEGLDQGLGIDAVPALALRQLRNNSESRVNEEFDPSLDLFYKITPSLTSVLTVNTDFSEAEPDKRSANLTRFSLFFPEQRDFFLQDAGIFNFADFGFRRNTDSKLNGQPFFSRRIALDETGPLSLRVGGKTTGVSDRSTWGSSRPAWKDTARWTGSGSRSRAATSTYSRSRGSASLHRTGHPTRTSTTSSSGGTSTIGAARFSGTRSSRAASGSRRRPRRTRRTTTPRSERRSPIPTTGGTGK